MTSEEQELESIRYAEWIKVVPLSTGRIGILGPRCEVFKVANDWSEVLCAIPELREAFKYTADERPAKPSNVVDIDVEL